MCSADESSGHLATHQFIQAQLTGLMFVNTKPVSAFMHSQAVVLSGWVQTWHQGHCLVKWLKKYTVTELQKQQRKRGNPVILFNIRKDLVLIEASCICATPSSLMLSDAKLVPLELTEKHDWPLQSPSCFAACCCTWLRFAALLKSVRLLNSCK